MTYFVTFRYRRPLEVGERTLLLRHLIKPDGRELNYHFCYVGPEATSMVFEVNEKSEGVMHELSAVIEKAKTKVGKLICKKSGERFSPFYGESFDRILRDEGELEAKWNEFFQEVEGDEWGEECLWAPAPPSNPREESAS